jgi:hypothetical protein
MGNCINVNHKDFKTLTEMSGLNPLILSAKMGVWMDRNNTDKWPTLEQLGLKDKSIKESVINPGVQELFESNPELDKIGTQEQYSRYLDTIFPDSKVKSIVYHGTDNKFEKFHKKYIGKTTKYPSMGYLPKGFYFTKDLSIIKEWGANILPVILNMKNSQGMTSEEFHNALDGEFIYDKTGDSVIIEGDEVNKKREENYLKNILNNKEESEGNKR